MAEKSKISAFVPLNRDEEHIWFPVFSMEAVFIIFINAATITTFSINRHLFGRAVYCIINLAVSDLLYGCFFLINCTYNRFRSYVESDTKSYEQQVRYLFAIQTLMIFCTSASATSMNIIAVERVLATFVPFRHHTTRLRVYGIVIGIAWCFCICVAIVHYLTPQEYTHVLIYFYFTMTILTVLIIIISYSAIYFKVKSQNKLHNNQQISADRLRERNMAYTLMLVTFVSFLTWIPISVVIILQQKGIKFSAHISACALVIQASNSFINSIIYAFRMEKFRKALVQLLCKCSRHPIHPVR